MDYIEQLQQYQRRARQILKLHKNGWTQVEIGEKFGITKQRVHQILNKMLVKKVLKQPK
jgi:DNA-directed RNA polymerase sigma subunit (sigma70/sigma32)